MLIKTANGMISKRMFHTCEAGHHDDCIIAHPSPNRKFRVVCACDCHAKEAEEVPKRESLIKMYKGYDILALGQLKHALKDDKALYAAFKDALLYGKGYLSGETTA